MNPTSDIVSASGLSVPPSEMFIWPPAEKYQCLEHSEYLIYFNCTLISRSFLICSMTKIGQWSSNYCVEKGKCWNKGAFVKNCQAWGKRKK